MKNIRSFTSIILALLLETTSNTTFSSELVKPCMLLTRMDGSADERLNKCIKDAINGDPEAQTQLASYYSNNYRSACPDGSMCGRYPPITKPDYNESFRWCVMADAQGSTDTFACMFRAYNSGLGAAKDHIEAYKYLLLEISDEQGFLDACKTCTSETSISISLESNIRQKSILEKELSSADIEDAKNRVFRWHRLHPNYESTSVRLKDVMK